MRRLDQIGREGTQRTQKSRYQESGATKAQKHKDSFGNEPGEYFFSSAPFCDFVFLRPSFSGLSGRRRKVIQQRVRIGRMKPKFTLRDLMWLA
jgi:hypothetical protein